MSVATAGIGLISYTDFARWSCYHGIKTSSTLSKFVMAFLFTTGRFGTSSISLATTDVSAGCSIADTFMNDKMLIYTVYPLLKKFEASASSKVIECFDILWYLTIVFF